MVFRDGGWEKMVLKQTVALRRYCYFRRQWYGIQGRLWSRRQQYLVDNAVCKILVLRRH